MNRFYIDEEYLMPDGLYLSPEDVHHAKNVLRLKVGDPVEIIHRRCRYAAAIAEISAERVRMPLSVFTEPPVNDPPALISCPSRVTMRSL